MASIGSIIGRVAIKVIPDTSDFRDEAAAKLNKIKQQLDGLDIVLIPEIEKAAEEKVKGEMKALKKKLDTKVEIWTEASKIALDRTKAQLASLRDRIKAQVYAIADMPALLAARAELAKLGEKITAPVHALANRSKAMAARLALETVLKHPILVDVIAHVSKTSLAVAKAELASLNASSFNLGGFGAQGAQGLGQLLGALSGVRVTAGIFKSFREELLNLDKMVPKIAVLSTAISGIGFAATGALASTLSFGSSLLSIGGAGLALPGILGAMGIATFVFGVAMKGFNQEFSNFSVSFAKKGQNMGSVWKELKQTVTENFWDKARAGMQSFLNSAFPPFQKGIEKISSSLGTFTGNLAKAFGVKLAPALPAMFTNLDKSIQITAGHTDAFASIITTLGTLGTNQLPALAAWFGKIADSFNGWLSKAAADGRLQGWVDQGVSSLNQLGGVLKNVWQIFGGIANAADAAGGKTLSSLNTALTTINQTVNSPAFQTTLTAVLKTVYDGLSQIANIAGPSVGAMFKALAGTFITIGPVMANTIGTAIKMIADLISNPAVQQGLQAMFIGINAGIKALQPAIGPLGDKLGVMLGLIGAMAAAIGPVLAAAIQAVAPVIVTLGTALQPIIAQASAIATTIITQLAPVFQTIATIIATQVVPAIAPLLTSVMNLWNLLAPVLIPTLQFLAELLGSLVVQAINGVMNIINGFIGVIQGLGQIFTGLIGIFTSGWQIIVGIFTLNGSKISEGLKGLWTAIGNIFNGIFNTISGVVQMIWGFVNVWFVGKVVGLFRGAIDAIVGFVKNLPGDIAGFAGSMLSAGVKLITGFLGGMGSMLQQGGNVIADVGSKIVNGIIGVLNRGIQAINDMIPNKISIPMAPDIDLPDNPIPQIPIAKFATGARFKSATVGIMGEGTEAETLFPDSKLKGFLGEMTSKVMDGLHLDISPANIAAQVDAALKVTTSDSSGGQQQPSIQIDNITIPLEDLAQLKDLQEFLDLLRVRARQGAA